MAQGLGHAGLVHIHIERSAGNGLVLQGLNQSGLVHHGATRHIDQIAVCTQGLEDLRINQVTGTRSAGRDDYQKIDLGGQLHHIRLIGVRNVGFRTACGVADLHVKGSSPLGNGLANAANTHNTQFGATDFAAQRERSIHPLVGAHKLIGLRQLAANGQHQGNGQIGHIVVQHFGGVRDRYATCDGGGHLHTVIAYTADGNHFQRRQLVHQSFVDLGFSAAHNGANAGQHLGCRHGVTLMDHKMTFQTGHQKRWHT